MSKVKESQVLKVVARAPFELYYEGDAKIVSATNKVGEFDVLPGHADFFSMLTACTVIIETSEKDPLEFDITNGIITVRDDEVLIFVNM